MKKIITLALAVIMVVMQTACGKEVMSASEPQKNSAAESSQSENPEESPYTMQVQIQDARTADIVIGGVIVDLSNKEASWSVYFDDIYRVVLQTFEETQCDVCKKEVNKDGTYNLPVIAKAAYEIAENTLTFHVSIPESEAFDFNQIQNYVMAIDETGTGSVNYSVAAKDVAVNGIQLGNEKAAASEQSKENENASADTAGHKYIGEYTGSNGTLKVTADKISVIFDNTEYSTSYVLEDIKENNGIGEYIFTANSKEVKIFFGKDGEIVEVYVGNSGAGYTRSNGTESADASSSDKNTLFAQGFYKGIQDGTNETIDGLRLESGNISFWIRGAAYTFEAKINADFYSKNIISGEPVTCNDGNTYYMSMRVNDDGTISLSVPDFVDLNGSCPIEGKLELSKE